MYDKNQNTNVIFSDNSASPAPSSDSLTQDSSANSLATLAVPLQPETSLSSPPKKTDNILVRLVKRADIVLAVLLVLGSLGLVLNASISKNDPISSAADQFDTTQLPLTEFISDQGISFGSQSVTVNGELLINNALVVAPSQRATSAVAGQMYYDQTANMLNLFNGTEFIPLGSTVAEASTNIQLQSVGSGLVLAGGQLSNTGVLSIQGQTENVILNAGNGIAINGTTISNEGVVSLVSGNSTLVITDDGSGNHVLTVNLGGAGVTSVNGQAGVLTVANSTGAGGTITLDDASTSAKGIAQFNPSNFSAASGVINTIQNINTGATPTFAGLNTNSITPSGALTIGATGQSFTLQGNATSTIIATGGGFTTALGFTGAPTGAVTYTLDRSVAPGTYALCSTVGNCAGSGTGVTSIVGGMGNRLAKFTAGQNIENSTITDDGTNVTTTADLVVQGGDVTIGIPSLQTGTLNFAHSGSGFLGSIVQGALSDDRQYLLPDADGTFCLTSGNCSGSGSSSTLQAAYDAGNTITTSDNRSIILTFADTATDANMLINLECDTACGGNGRFALQDDGADIVAVAPSAIVLGSATTNVPITVSSGTGAINIGNGAEARTVNVGTGVAAQTVTIGSTDTTSTTLIQGGTGNITLNSGGTIALQDSTTVAGNLTIAGAATDTLTVQSPGNGSGAVVLNLQQSDNDSVLRVTDTGTLTIGSSTNVAGILALANGAGADLVEIKVDNVTANRTLQLPDVSGIFCTDAGNCGTTTGTLQNAYTYSTGGTTPEIKLDTTRNGIEIQDANVTIGNGQNFLSLRGPNAGGLGSILVGFGTEGNLFMQPSVNRTDLVDINTNGGANLLTVDSVNSRVGVGLGGSTLPSFTLDVGGTLNTSGAVTLGSTLAVTTLGTANTATYLCRNGTNQIAACSITGTAVAFVQDGNSFGATAVLGTNDSNSLTLETNNATQATIAVGGATTFQNSANSSSAFRILNAAGTGEHLGLDTTDSIMRLLASNTGHLSGTGANWNTASTLTAARSVVGAVTVNGYVYSVGGCDDGGVQPEVYYAPANSDGTLGSWTATTSLPVSMCGHAVTTYNGYIYANGATGSATTARDIVYAKPNADGTITSWTTQNDPTNLIGLKDHGMAAYNGYLYITAGQSDDGLDTRNRNIYYGRIMADGSVPSFAVQTNWLDDQDHIPGQAVIANGFLYVMGSANYDKFYYGRINADGTVAANALATGTTASKKYASIAVMNGYMYVIAGGTTATNTIEYGPLANSGDIGAFTTDTIALPATRWLCPKNAVTLNGYLYVYGCADAGDDPTNTVYYAGGSRVKVGASLDLVGYSGENMGAGSSGGQLTAGNTFVNGALSVTGNTNLRDGATVGNALNVLGTASVQTATNTPTGFQVLNASAVPLLQADTSNSRVYIGNPTTDSTGAILVLDTKDSASDPTATGLGGAMYYSSYLGSLRCYEGDKWVECLGMPKPNTNRTTNMVANGDDNVWGGYGDILVNTAPLGSGGSLSNNLVPSVYNDTTATIGSVAGVSGGTIYSGSRLVYQTHFDQPVQTSIRVWLGLTTETIATMGGSATPAGAFAAFRYDTGAGDATWKCITRDGSAATTTNSTIAPAPDQKFEIILDDASRAVFKINGQIVCTNTTNIPNDELLRVSNSITALDADSKTIYIGWIYVEGDPI